MTFTPEQERADLRTMTTRELVAYWNVMQFPGLVITDGKQERHLVMVDEILTERGVAHQRGKLTDRKAA